MMKKWFLRILIVFCVLVGLGLLSLHIISGTSETQKRGLEQAFSQIFQGNARFDKLLSFNLFPEFTLEVSGLELSGMKGVGGKEGVVQAEHISIVFGSADLFFNTRMIQKFDVKNFVMAEGTYFPLRLNVAKAGIFPDEGRTTARFRFSGLYGDGVLDGEIAMVMVDGAHPKYGLAEENIFTMTVGLVQAKGVYVPYQQIGGEVKNLKLMARGKKGEEMCALPQARVFPSSVFFKDVLASMASVKTAAELKKVCLQLETLPLREAASVETVSGGK